MCRGQLAEAGEPTPAAVGELHVSQPADARGGHPRDFVRVEDRVVLVTLPAAGPLARIAQLLGIEVGVPVANRLQIYAEVDQNLLRDDRWQEPIECLLGAAV